MGGRAKWDWVCLTRRRAKKCRQGDIGLAGASAVATATVRQYACCAWAAVGAPARGERGLGKVLHVLHVLGPWSPGPSTTNDDRVSAVDVHDVDVLARLTSLGLRSSRVSFGGAALVLMLAGWLPCAYSTSNWDHLHANQTKPPHQTLPGLAPCHCPSAVRACAPPPLRQSESPPSLTHVPHDVASSTRSLHLLPGLPAPPDRLFDR